MLARSAATQAVQRARESPMATIAGSLEEALAPITDGCTLLVPRGNAGVAMAATRALVRRGAKRLNLVAVPTSGIQADLLIGAGCVESIEAAGVSLGGRGPSPPCSAAAHGGEVPAKDNHCPALDGTPHD